MTRSSRSPWCDAGWNGCSEPLSGNTRFCASRPVLKVMMRVMSDWNASTCRSNIRRMCSENESGTPAGASGSSRSSPLLVARFDRLDAALDLANVGQVAIEARPIARAELLAHRRHFALDPVEDAAAADAALGAIGLRRSGAEQHVERDARIANHRQRLVRRRPADRVGVGARVVVGAAAGLVEVLDAELHRRQRRRLCRISARRADRRRCRPRCRSPASASDAPASGTPRSSGSGRRRFQAP